MNPKKPKPIFEEKVIKVLSEKKHIDDKGFTHLRIAAFIVNGKETPAVIEKREIRINNGVRQHKKRMGLDLNDLNVLCEKRAEIQRLMS